MAAAYQRDGRPWYQRQIIRGNRGAALFQFGERCFRRSRLRCKETAMKRGRSRRSSRVGGKYEVGYARPPLHSRFKRGQSGNPKGRPRGSRSVASVLHRILNEKVPAREGDKV